MLGACEGRLTLSVCPPAAGSAEEGGASRQVPAEEGALLTREAQPRKCEEAQWGGALRGDGTPSERRAGARSIDARPSPAAAGAPRMALCVVKFFFFGAEVRSGRRGSKLSISMIYLKVAEVILKPR